MLKAMDPIVSLAGTGEAMYAGWGVPPLCFPVRGGDFKQLGFSF